jgi:hypothetical protein
MWFRFDGGFGCSHKSRAPDPPSAFCRFGLEIMGTLVERLALEELDYSGEVVISEIGWPTTGCYFGGLE